MQRTHLEAAQRYESEALRDKRDPFVLAVPKIYDESAGVGQKWALVVGISQFQPEIGAERCSLRPTMPSLRGAAARSESRAAFPGNQVFQLTDEAATTGSDQGAAEHDRRARQTRGRGRRLHLDARLAALGRPAEGELSLHLRHRRHEPRSDIRHRPADGRDLGHHQQPLSSRSEPWRSSTRATAARASIPGRSRPEDIDRLREGAGRYIISSCEPDQKSYEDARARFLHGELDRATAGAARDACG